MSMLNVTRFPSLKLTLSLTQPSTNLAIPLEANASLKLNPFTSLLFVADSLP